MRPSETLLLARARTVRKWQVCEKSTFLSLCLAKGAACV
jgi:hypothetical protein